MTQTCYYSLPITHHWVCSLPTVCVGFRTSCCIANTYATKTVEWQTKPAVILQELKVKPPGQTPFSGWGINKNTAGRKINDVVTTKYHKLLNSVTVSLHVLWLNYNVYKCIIIICSKYRNVCKLWELHFILNSMFTASRNYFSFPETSARKRQHVSTII